LLRALQQVFTNPTRIAYRPSKMRPALPALITLGFLCVFASCGASGEQPSADDLKSAVSTYYSKHYVRSLGHLNNPEMFAGIMQQIRRLEVKNSYTRAIDGEQFQFYDIAVETQSGAGLITELLPLKFVKRGNSWYSSIDREREIQQLPKGSLSQRAVSIASDSKMTAASPPSISSTAPASVPDLRGVYGGDESMGIDPARRGKLGSDFNQKSPPKSRDSQRAAETADSTTTTQTGVKRPPGGLDSADPREFARAFYSWVIGSREDPGSPGHVLPGLTKEEIVAGGEFFDPQLLHALKAYEEGWPRGDGDDLLNAEPFTGSQDSISPEFTISSPSGKNDTVTVPVTLHGDRMTLVLHRTNGRWHVKDIVYPDQTTLKRILDEQLRLDQQRRR
jgi:hypothetical protein